MSERERFIQQTVARLNYNSKQKTEIDPEIAAAIKLLTDNGYTVTKKRNKKT